MTKIRIVKAHLITGLIFVVLAAHLPVLYTHFYHQITDAPTATDGIMMGSKFSAEHSLVLDGKWEFYWNRLAATDAQQDIQPDFLIQVPDNWTKYKINGARLPCDGYASYRLVVKGLESPMPVTVHIPSFGSAYRVFIDGTLTAESGVVSKNLDNVFAIPQSKLYPVTLSPGAQHTIIIEVATTRFSGLYMAPVLQEFDRAVAAGSNREDLRYLLFGIVLFCFFALFVIYCLPHKRNKSSLWLLGMILCVLLRLMLTTEFFVFWQKTIFHTLSYEDANPIMFLATFVLKFLLIFLLQDHFGVSFTKKEKAGFILYYALIYLAYLFIPHAFYNQYLTIVLPVASFALEVYSFFKIYLSVRQLKKYAVPVYWGVVFAISGLTIDCYYLNGNVYPDLSLSLLVCLTSYLIIITLVYAMRLSDIQNQNALFSSQLDQAKQRIAMQAEYYDALSEQINEVRTIKHDFRHVIGVLRRLSAEERYADLDRFLNESGEKADAEPLPVYCENAVVNSILGYYALKAKQNGILFRCACGISKGLTVKDSDLCVILGNALENALEACVKAEDTHTRYISTEAGIYNGQLLIRVENSFSGPLLREEDGSYATTKSGEFHGIGLRSIRKVVQSHGGFLRLEQAGTSVILMAALPQGEDMYKHDVTKSLDSPAS